MVISISAPLGTTFTEVKKFIKTLDDVDFKDDQSLFGDTSQDASETKDQLEEIAEEVSALDITLSPAHSAIGLIPKVDLNHKSDSQPWRKQAKWNKKSQAKQRKLKRRK